MQSSGNVGILCILIICLVCPITCDPLKKSKPNSSVADISPLIGFDCNVTEPEVLSVSTLEIGACPELATLQPHLITEFGQIIQKRNYKSVHVRSCQLTRSTFYFRCGANWVNYQVYPPSIENVVVVSKKKCDDVHTTGYYNWHWSNTPWGELHSNMTYHFSKNEIGWTDSKGYCEGGSYTINGVAHQDIVVQTSYTFTLRDSYSKVDIDEGRINIEGSLGCTYKDGYCMDSKTGTHTWTPEDIQCGEDEYVLLYEGLVNKTTSKEDSKVLLTVNNPPFLFTSEMGLTTYSCGMNLGMTEFPEIFYLPQVHGSYQKRFKHTTGLDIKLITYLNAKLTFTYHTLFDNAKSMYLASVHQTCLVEREMLKNRIEIIRLNSASGGLSSLLSDGMFAKINGEVIHLVKCEPVAVKFRQSNTCYNSLPITYNGKDMFLLPNSHIIAPHAVALPCSPITPLTYKIGASWWAYTGTFQQVSPPTVLHPQTRALPKFTKIKSFSKGGMYSEQQVEAVQKLLAFPSLRDSITSDLASGLGGFGDRIIHMDLTDIMSEADWKKVAKKNLLEVWGYFAQFGSFMSGLIGFYVIFKMIKGALSMVINARDLYRLFGCSFTLLASVWTRLAIYFVHQGNVANSSRTNEPDDEEMSSEDFSPTAPLESPTALANFSGYRPSITTRVDYGPYSPRTNTTKV